MNPNTLNTFFVSTTHHTIQKDAISPAETSFIHTPTADNENKFHLHYVTRDNVMKELRNLKNYCSTDHDTVPVPFFKPVAEFLCSPLT